MNASEMFENAKRATADQRTAHQAVLNSVSDAADLAVLRNASTSIAQLAETMALAKVNPQ